MVVCIAFAPFEAHAFRPCATVFTASVEQSNSFSHIWAFAVYGE